MNAGPVAAVALLVAVALAGCTVPAGDDGQGAAMPLEAGEPAADLLGATGWLGSQPLDLGALRGQVVLVDFWTYSCINCIRTLPHLTAWYETYRDDGFVIVGVHSPEFDFEKDPANVVAAMEKHGIHYPVAQDNDFTVWRAYENRYWPAKYLLDAEGNVRYTHFGEGSYEETEQTIRALLREAGHGPLPPAVEGDVRQGARGTDISPELYAGTWRQEWTLADGYDAGADVVHTLPTGALQRDRIFLDGTWHHGHEALTARTDGVVALHFKAGAANIVLGADGQAGTCLPLLLDGGPIPQELAGADVRFDGPAPCVLLAGDDSYDLYNGPVEAHELRLEVPAGIELYTFAFSAYERGVVA
ncbi:MAG: redoxin domain-containing protein [Thermoplasmatota archaeon]